MASPSIGIPSILLGTLRLGPFRSITFASPTADKIIGANDMGAFVDTTGGAIVLTLGNAATDNVQPWQVFFFNKVTGAGALNLTPRTGLINGAATLIVGGVRGVVFDGTNYFSLS